MQRPDEDLPLSRQKPVPEDVRLEIEAHLRMREEELREQGLSPDEARAAARRAFGDLPAIESQCREITARHRRAKRRARILEALGQDVVVGARVLRKSPGFTLAAVLTLALGIGANTAIFSIVNGVLLRPLPYPHPERLVAVVETRGNGGWANPAWTNFKDYVARSHSFDAMASWWSGVSTVLGADEPLRVPAATISRDFFRVTGAAPMLGRLPSADEHALGANPVAVVSHAFWRTHLGARRLDDLHLRLDRDYQVVGVLPPGFDYPDGAEVWVPLELNRMPTSRTAHAGTVTARLREGVTAAQAQAELTALVKQLAAENPEDFDAEAARVTPLQEDLTGSLRTPLLLLLGAAGVLLLAACTNVASTLLARGTARSQELAVRAALGAGRLRIVRQLFTESLLLAGLGCAAGLALSLVLVRALASLAPPTLGVLEDARLDSWVLAFTVVVSLVTATLFGLLPALRISATDAGTVLREGARGGVGRHRHRLWSVLVAVEVALAVVLLAGSGVLIRSFASVLDVDPGFRAEGVLTVDIDLPESTYPDLDRAVRFHDRALDAIRAIPGVDAAGVTNLVPLEGEGARGGIQVEGLPPIPPYGITGFATYRLAGPGYFKALGIRVLRGRTFTEQDNAGAPPVIIVNRALAERDWPGEDPIGRRMRAAGMDPEIGPYATVVGVVDDVANASLIGPRRPTYWYPYRQVSFRVRNMTAVIHTTLPPASITGAVRRAMRAVDPAVPLAFRTMPERVRRSVADRRFTMVVLGAFAAVALLLAAIGIYGVVSYAVAQRTREIGIRLALGADPARVRRLVQGRAMATVAVGLVIGIAGAAIATRVLRSLVYEVKATDPAAFAAAVILLAGAAWLASWVPARRGTRVDPMLAIRAE